MNKADIVDKVHGVIGSTKAEAERVVETVISSIVSGLKAGDEVLVCKQDYPHMLTAWKQREKRDGIKLNQLNLNLPLENESQIVKLYEESFIPEIGDAISTTSLSNCLIF